MKTSRSVVVALVLSILVGLFLVVSGGLLIWGRQAADILFDTHGANTLQGDSLATAMGIRQLCIGLMIVSLACLRQTKALGVVMIIGALVPLVDFLSFAPKIGSLSALRHGVVAPIVLGIGIFLLASKVNVEQGHRADGVR